MQDVIPENAVDYLRATGRIPADRAASACALGWGVSNVVLRVDVEGEAPIVLKQARAKLRTKALWVSRLDRIWTEKAALELLAPLLPPGTVPIVLFEDRANYLFAMSSAPDDSAVWKEQLLAGTLDPAVARLAGETLGTIHAATAGHPALARPPLDDPTVFDELRIDPFYRTIARVHPDLAPRIEAIRDPHVADRRFVHADFSPKNILVHAHGLTLVDFETAHAGDPAYDVGFVLSHLLLKAIRAAPDEGPMIALARALWDGYRARVGAGPADALLARGNLHLAACALARVDGKSPVEYLDDPRRDVARRFARAALWEAPETWDDMLGVLARELLEL